jgi:short subunit dehydrogenase-like uncharacterized protein
VHGTRALDVVLYGATGFVGRLTAAYLAGHAPGGARIGLGGRSREKLTRLRDELGARAADWPLLVADSSDRAALDELARRTAVVATTVGPYMSYGLPLSEACAAAGTHYADLTGEVLFMRESIDRNAEAAAASGARIVHTCGFDSIPSDLGALLLHTAAGDDPLERVTLVVKAAKGGASGGTIASLTGQLDQMRDRPELRRLAEDPYALSPDRAAEPDLGDERDPRGIAHDDDLGVWLAPFVMGMVNTRVVRRSNALQDWAYGRGMRYRETMSCGSGPVGRAKAAAVAGALLGTVAGLSFGPTRKVLDRVLPEPGQGPNEKARTNGFFRIELHGRTASGARHVATVAAQGDPGYQATALMLGESALCLALDEPALPARAGVLTPATAMGMALVDRLRAAGMTLTVE